MGYPTYSRLFPAFPAFLIPSVPSQREEGIDLRVIKLPAAKKGFVLLPKRWVVERSFGWLNRFRRLARDYERLPETLIGFHFVVFMLLMLGNAVTFLQSS
jgi:hypothetical protein